MEQNASLDADRFRVFASIWATQGSFSMGVKTKNLASERLTEIGINTAACWNGAFFDNSLNDKRFRIDIQMENGYEEGWTLGARR